MKKLYLLLFPAFLLFTHGILAQEKVSLSGYLRDASNGESLIGATILIPSISAGNVTNVYGFYSLTVPPGTYTITFSYVGYQQQERVIQLTANQKLDVELTPANQQLDEVVVTASPEDENVNSLEMSVAKLDIKTIEKIPAFLGEVDIVKSLQLLPGVTAVGEGASGFNVRGGSVGQNLVLLDEAPVYNSSHMLGFFSVFNPDAVKDVKLFKGGIPSKYGGRLSSILDIRMKDGNAKKYEVNGGIGTIFSRLAVQGPLAKNKASFILAGRRSYIDILARPILNANDLSGVGLYFYDLTFKSNYKVSDKDQLYLSGYMGRDVFKFDADQGFNWGNKTSSLRWNHLFNERLFSNTTAYVSDYDYAFQFGDDDDLFSWKSRILTYDLKEQFTFFLNSRNEISFGGEAILYRFKPAKVRGVSDGEETDISLEERQSLETALYVSNDQQLNEKLSFQYGVRWSGYSYLGPGSVYTYNDTTAGDRRTVVSTKEASDWETIQFYYNFEPRFSFKYSLNATTSIKGSYNRMVQYIHLISNTTASLPTDVWTSSTNNIKPQLADQVALGVFKNFHNNMYESSIEVYYKASRHQVDYIDGADLLINQYLEGDLLMGKGRSYGAEFYFKKNTGKLTGWISYTLAKTELKVNGINSDRWYPTRYDQRHNLKITGSYELNDRWQISSTFTYITGTPYTLPSYRYDVQGYTIPGVTGRNNGRIPSYNRLDFAATWYMREEKSNGKPKKVRDYWVFSVYNAYARRNPFSIYFSQAEGLNGTQSTATTQARQVSIIGTVIPAVSYNFKF